MDDDLITEAAALLCEAQHPVALTGAGISTPSGIPDFRSPGTGLWEHANPMDIVSIRAFRRDPQAFYDWMRPLVEVMRAAEANPAHRALAELERAGHLRAVLTQNIDGLHQRGGSQEVLELHGHTRDVVCLDCHWRAPADRYLDDFLATGAVPRCPRCGNWLKPDVVLFGEPLPLKVLNRALEHAARADLMLVVGSSLVVTPASQLPLMVLEHGGRGIIVNLTPTYLDSRAAVVIHADVVTALPAIVRACGER
ncbi:MAG TPA: NAD-dependent deacylase [Anaerolineae bacterium]|nr:NAD-dependent deacylase [Anaerolineae bacterium]